MLNLCNSQCLAFPGPLMSAFFDFKFKYEISMNETYNSNLIFRNKGKCIGREDRGKKIRF